MVKPVFFGAVGVFIVSILAAPALAQGDKAPDYEAIVTAPDRSDADRQTDQPAFPPEAVRATPARLAQPPRVRSV